MPPAGRGVALLKCQLRDSKLDRCACPDRLANAKLTLNGRRVSGRNQCLFVKQGAFCVCVIGGNVCLHEFKKLAVEM